MKKDELTFTSRHGVVLSARLEQPAENPVEGYLLLAHCFTCSKDLSSLRRLARTLAEYGFGVMSFDFTGLGHSQGDFSDSGFSTQMSDLIDAAAFMSAEYQSPLALIGHSLGGTACLYAAREISGLKGVATIGSPYDPSHVERLFAGSLDEIERNGAAEVSIGDRPFMIRKNFLEDLRNHPPEQWLGDLSVNLMILHSPVDEVVNIVNAEKIFKAVKHPKSFISLRQADHLLSQSKDAVYAGRILGAWAESFIEGKNIPEELKTGSQVAARIGKDHYTVNIRAGNHIMTADEPFSLGGADRGGNPYDYLLASLGACTTITLRMYADRKTWPLNAVTVHLDHQKIHDKDSPEGDQWGEVDLIQRRLVLDGDLDEKQKNRLLSIAERCPVHRTLSSKTRIETSLEGP